MKIETVPLFSSAREMIVFGAVILSVFAFSLLREYIDFRELTRFDDAERNATVLNQYVKQKGQRRYQVLKLRLDDGAQFYMAGSMRLRDLKGYGVRVRIRTDTLTYFEYLQGFYAKGYVLAMASGQVPRFVLANTVAGQHADARFGELFAALFAATPVDYETRQRLSALGISHLLAISGFHMGALSLMLFALLHYPYRFAQSRWFPWRNRRRDLFVAAAVLLAGYAVFLGAVPSVLRALAMMLVGFWLYDRGVKVLNFQTLSLAVGLLVALWPRLIFSVGFWLSAAGVFYIFLFLTAFQQRGKVFQFIGLHVWVYAMMLPWALYLFGSFSLLHPFSVLWTMAFIVFYPLAMLTHLLGAGALLDPVVGALLVLGESDVTIALPGWLAVLFALASILAVKSQAVKWQLGGLAAAVFVSAVYQVA